jgi:hypothetical protein
MLDETLIKRKHAEYYKKYSGQSIDDYDNYVMSRTIEYFYNKEQFPVDKLVDFITSSLKKASPCGEYGLEQNKSSDDVRNVRTDDLKGGLKSKIKLAKRKIVRRRKQIKKSWPFFLIGAISVGGFVRCLFSRKK